MESAAVEFQLRAGPERTVDTRSKQLAGALRHAVVVVERDAASDGVDGGICVR